MSEKDNKFPKSDYDIFIASKIYPHAAQLFAPHSASIEDVKDTAIIVIDTNALVVPYNTGQDSLDSIRKIYRDLVAQKRLIIPAQVAREFAKIRSLKIAEVFQKLAQTKSQIKKFRQGQHPLLESIDQYQQMQHLAGEIDDKISEYKDAIDGVLAAIRIWNWNDPVSDMYRDVFDEKSSLPDIENLYE